MMTYRSSQSAPASAHPASSGIRAHSRTVETRSGDGQAPAAVKRDETLDVVRGKVREILTRSAAFRALPESEKVKVARDTVTVARFIADANGVTADVPVTAIIDNPANALGALARPFFNQPNRPNAPSTGQRGFTGAQDGYSNPAASSAPGLMEGLVDAVDFPSFCAGLIEGVFTAIVDTSIKQMEAYSAMVANVAKSVDAYMRDNVTPEQAQDQLVNGQPDLFEADLSGQTPLVRARPDADPQQMGQFLQGLGLPFDLDTSDPETVQAEVVTSQRYAMAMDRQKLLATMVLMGINRIVVTDGKIQASVVFDISTKDVMRRNQEISTSFEENYRQTHNRKKKNGWWIFSNGSENQSTRLNVKTNVDTSQTDSSTSQTDLKAKLTGNVDLRFKSDYFPLDKMLDMLGTNQAEITTTAQRPMPGQAATGGGMAAPPPPALPPPPPFVAGGTR